MISKCPLFRGYTVILGQMIREELAHNNNNMRTFLEGRVAEEEVVAGSCRSLLASIGLQHCPQFPLDFVQLVEDGEDSFVDELVWMFLAHVESALQIHWRNTLCGKNSRNLMIMYTKWLENRQIMYQFYTSLCRKRAGRG